MILVSGVQRHYRRFHDGDIETHNYNEFQEIFDALRLKIHYNTLEESRKLAFDG